MKADIKAKWVAALRSGNYKQATGNLKTNVGHCCLGVLTELAIQDGVDLHQEKFYIGSKSWKISFNANSYYLSPEVIGWAEFPDKVGVLPEVDVTEAVNTEMHLSNMNDSARTFDEIADWIEENL